MPATGGCATSSGWTEQNIALAISLQTSQVTLPSWASLKALSNVSDSPHNVAKPLSQPAGK
ncbi:hypothetical protein [Hafnia alvei]|uniref:Uncharacterized protein n=1 Tax=Hafnia alvei TaxID=569 RepID=A0ABD7Q3V9_HAFAL|nr:hypothetical protein [Hafnia alvei]TBL65025.1 hypothetical protein EYY96_22030 [Hafnia alvei]